MSEYPYSVRELKKNVELVPRKRFRQRKRFGFGRWWWWWLRLSVGFEGGWVMERLSIEIGVGNEEERYLISMWMEGEGEDWWGAK